MSTEDGIMGDRDKSASKVPPYKGAGFLSRTMVGQFGKASGCAQMI